VIRRFKRGDVIRVTHRPNELFRVTAVDPPHVPNQGLIARSIPGNIRDIFSAAECVLETNLPTPDLFGVTRKHKFKVGDLVRWEDPRLAHAPIWRVTSQATNGGSLHYHLEDSGDSKAKSYASEHELIYVTVYPTSAKEIAHLLDNEPCSNL